LNVGSLKKAMPPKINVDWDCTDPSDPKGYYAYFGLSPTAKLKTIKFAYIKVLDECAGNPLVLNAAKEAYDVLSDPIKRRKYDTQLTYNTDDGAHETGPLSDYKFRTAGKPIETCDQVYVPTKQGSGCMIVFFALFTGAWLLTR